MLLGANVRKDLSEKVLDEIRSWTDLIYDKLDADEAESFAPTAKERERLLAQAEVLEDLYQAVGQIVAESVPDNHADHCVALHVELCDGNCR